MASRHSTSRAFLLSAFLGWTCVSCAGEPSLSKNTEIDSAGVRVVISGAPLQQWSLNEEPELEVGSPDTGGPTEFFQIEAVRFLSRGRFVVANRGTEELRFFDVDGRFDDAAGGAGRGPEEFRGLNWAVVLGDSLLAYDWGNDRISVWDELGRYRRSFRLAWVSGVITPTAILGDGTLLSLTVRHMTELEGTGTLLDIGLISRHDLDGALIDSVGRYPVGERVVQREGTLQTTVTLPLGSRGRFAARCDGFCHVFGPDFEIRCYGADGTPRSIARIDSAHGCVGRSRDRRVARRSGNRADPALQVPSNVSLS